MYLFFCNGFVTLFNIVLKFIKTINIYICLQTADQFVYSTHNTCLNSLLPGRQTPSDTMITLSIIIEPQIHLETNRQTVVIAS